MKYSVRGYLQADNKEEIMEIINRYTLWRLIAEKLEKMSDDESEFFTFEAWLNNEESKTLLFNNLKPYVVRYDEWIDWHICTHDEAIAQPCVIEERYRGE